MNKTLQTEIAILAGGCFWGMEDLLRRVPGVISTEVGYCGGNVPNATYEIVKAGNSGHAESVKVEFDPTTLSYGHLLFEFFRYHDPTTRNRQCNDVGSQYRSVIFYSNEDQRKVAENVMRTANDSGEWRNPVTTELLPLKEFYRAEDYHQQYLIKHPNGYSCHFIRPLKLGEC